MKLGKFKITLIFRPYDFRIGPYWDFLSRALDICLLPMLAIRIERRGPVARFFDGLPAMRVVYGQRKNPGQKMFVAFSEGEILKLSNVLIDGEPINSVIEGMIANVNQQITKRIMGDGMDSTVNAAAVAQAATGAELAKESEPKTLIQKVRTKGKRFLGRLKKGMSIGMPPITAADSRERIGIRLRGRKKKIRILEQKLKRRQVIRDAKGGKGAPRLNGEACDAALRAAGLKK
jgi:hypothetical protein